MPNNYFQFKKFRIDQEDCSMKMCTDSSIFGAYTACEIVDRNLNPKNILDIGGGTGLLSLMLAQRVNAVFDAIEIQKRCCLQMKNNFENSPWKLRLNAIQGDILKWKSETKYEFIISNPPFYENDLRAESAGKSIAMHDSGLLLSDLIKLIGSHIAKEGWFSVMIPSRRKDYFESLLKENNATIVSVLSLRDNQLMNPFRLIYLCNYFSHGNAVIKSEFTIKEDGSHSRAFRNLLSSYYLNL